MSIIYQSCAVAAPVCGQLTGGVATLESRLVHMRESMLCVGYLCTHRGVSFDVVMYMLARTCGAMCSFAAAMAGQRASYTVVGDGIH